MRIQKMTPLPTGRIDKQPRKYEPNDDYYKRLKEIKKLYGFPITITDDCIRSMYA